MADHAVFSPQRAGADGQLADICHTRLIPLFGKIPDIQLKYRTGAVTLKLFYPVIPFASFRILRRLSSGQHRNKLMRHQQRVLQLTFGRHRVCGLAGKDDFRITRVPVLIDKFSNAAAVQGIAKISPKRRNIKCFCTS